VTSPPTGSIDAILAGDVRVAARLMRDLDDRRPAAIERDRAGSSG
jgi:hypothetical protein